MSLPKDASSELPTPPSQSVPPVLDPVIRAAPGLPGFYVTGGTLPLSSRSYVERQADRELLRSLWTGEFCYVLTARQMGKSSLMVRTASRLREQGATVIVIDLTAIGQNVTPEQWYDGLALRLGRQIGREDEIESFWSTRLNLGPCQRFFTAIREILLQPPSESTPTPADPLNRASNPNPAGSTAVAPAPGQPLVIFVDEIDAVRSLKFSTDEFFAAIRECYNRRPEDPAFCRLTFCLLGVATPASLVQDPRTTPFNIGRRILLSDFTPSEAAPLAQGLLVGDDGLPDMEPVEAQTTLERILYWTGGQPFLTQRFCRAVAEYNDAATRFPDKIRSAFGIDSLCRELFLSHRSRETDDNLHIVRDRLLRAEVDRVAILEIYRRVLRGGRVPDDETNPLINALRLSGIVRADGGRLALRNRIYGRVFDEKWVEASLPDAEKQRQKRAFRRGALRGSVAALVILCIGLLGLWQAKQRRIRAILDTVGDGYHGLSTYQDRCEILQEIEPQNGERFTLRTVLETIIAKPDKLNLTLSGNYEALGDSRFQFIQDGRRLWVYAPDYQIYQESEVTNSLPETLATILRPFPRPVQESLYSLVMSAYPKATLHLQARGGIDYLRTESYRGRRYYLLSWEKPERPVRLGASILTNRQTTPLVPVRAWVRESDGLFYRLELDLTEMEQTAKFTNPTTQSREEIPIHSYTARIRHDSIRVNQKTPASTFVFSPPPGSRAVSAIDPLELFRTERSRSRSIAPKPSRTIERIPPRNAQADSTLIDLSSFYNAALTQSWHSPIPGNDLRNLPRGLQTFLDVPFDVRGVIQLAGNSPFVRQVFPSEVRGIPIRQPCSRIHFLHGTGWSASEGTQIGSYLLRYDDGETRLSPIIYGYDLRNWIPGAGEPSNRTGLRKAWEGANSLSPQARLFLSTWVNPRPDVEVATLDFRSSMTAAAPFLIAISVEK